MATKATIQALINANLASSSMITAAEHRAVENQLLNEFYPNTLTVTQADTTIFTAATISGVVFSYKLNVVKIGRLVTITGYIHLTTSSSITNRVYATITNSEFLGQVIYINPNGNQYVAPFSFYPMTTEGGYIHINSSQQLEARLSLGTTQVFFQYFTQS